MFSVVICMTENALKNIKSRSIKLMTKAIYIPSNVHCNGGLLPMKLNIFLFTENDKME